MSLTIMTLSDHAQRLTVVVEAVNCGAYMCPTHERGRMWEYFKTTSKKLRDRQFFQVPPGSIGHRLADLGYQNAAPPTPRLVHSRVPKRNEVTRSSTTSLGLSTDGKRLLHFPLTPFALAASLLQLSSRYPPLSELSSSVCPSTSV